MKQLTLLLKPRWGEDTVANMSVYAAYPASEFDKDLSKPALQYAEQAFGGLCPFPEWEDFSITDDLGDIPFEIKDIPSFYTAATFKGIFFLRAPDGEVKWSMKLLPRVLPEGYRSSPYYDFRAEPLGLNGSNMFSIIFPAVPIQTPVAVHLDWDLSEMPEGARGIWSYGEGAVDKVLPLWQIMITLYNTGMMHAVEEDGFGVYWFSEPNFDAESVARRMLPIFHYEKNYFGDGDAQFRVFLRRDPFVNSNGGSACPYAFISGYSAYGGADPERWFNTLLHEMTHTWPSMTDFNVGEGPWFSEGGTEYYCTILPYKGGFVDAKFTVDRLNEKIRDRYLDNIYRNLSNEEIAEIQWKDRRAQTVPYGRGFLYLANLEAKLKRLGKGSIDELVRKHSIVRPVTPKEWEDFVVEKLGDEGLRDFEDMKAGKIPVLEADLFGSDIVTVPHEIELNGKIEQSYHWEVRK